MNNLTIPEQFVKVFFHPETIEKVKEQFSSGIEKVPIDMFDMNFRLFKASNRNINLEFLATGHLGHYFKPIGFFDNELSITLVHEFENDFLSIVEKGELPVNSKIKHLSLKQNAVVAAFSLEVIIVVLQTFEEISKKGYMPEFRDGRMIPANLRYDKKLISNGYQSELIMTHNGYPQFFLDDDYHLDGPIGAYFVENDCLNTNPILEYKALYDSLISMSLLSAYKRL